MWGYGDHEEVTYKMNKQRIMPGYFAESLMRPIELGEFKHSVQDFVMLTVLLWNRLLQEYQLRWQIIGILSMNSKNLRNDRMKHADVVHEKTFNDYALHNITMSSNIPKWWSIPWSIEHLKIKIYENKKTTSNQKFIWIFVRSQTFSCIYHAIINHCR